MPRHRSRQSATHELTATRADAEQTCSADSDCPPGYHCENGVCVDTYGSPAMGERTVVNGEPVEYDPEETDYVRTESGGIVTRTPVVKGRAAALLDIDEGDTIALTPLAESGGDAPLDNLEAVSVVPVKTRRARYGRAKIELEQN